MADLEAVVEQAHRSWNSGDLAGYLAMYDPSMRLHGYAPEPMDKAATVKFYEEVWLALGMEGKPNPSLELHETVANGDLFACRYTMQGIHRADIYGVRATGRSYKVTGITIARFASGRIVERWSATDIISLLTQLGAITPPDG